MSLYQCTCNIVLLLSIGSFHVKKRTYCHIIPSVAARRLMMRAAAARAPSLLFRAFRARQPPLPLIRVARRRSSGRAWRLV